MNTPPRHITTYTQYKALTLDQRASLAATARRQGMKDAYQLSRTVGQSLIQRALNGARKRFGTSASDLAEKSSRSKASLLIYPGVVIAALALPLVFVPALAQTKTQPTAQGVSTDGQVNPAPGKGEIAGISERTAISTPYLFKFDDLKKESLGPGLTRQYIHGVKSTLTKWTFEKGAVVGLHYHPHEQISWIVSGRAEVYSNGKKYELNAGDLIIIPPNVPHEFHFPVKTINIDFWAPARQDWIDKEKKYLPKS